jgi:hypothetical protein
MIPINQQVTSVEDTLKNDLEEIDKTGRLSAGEKALRELNRRKLLTPKYSFCTQVEHGTKARQETSLVFNNQGPIIQYLASKTRDRLDGRDVGKVRCFHLPYGTANEPMSGLVALGRVLALRITTLTPRVYHQEVVHFIHY